MFVSFKLAVNYLKSNKRKTFISIICILISVVLITMILLLIDTYKAYMLESKRLEGNWEIRYNDITYNEAEMIEKYSNTKEISIIHYLTSEAISSKEGQKYNIVLNEYDSNALKNLVANYIVEGSLPNNSNEIILSTNFDYVVGDKISIILNDETVEYTLVGKIDNIDNINMFEAITFLDRNTLEDNEKVDITILSKDINRVYDDYYSIAPFINSYKDNDLQIEDQISYNNDLLEYADIQNYTSEYQKNVNTIQWIFISIIVLISLIFLYSIINIEILERSKYFGKLKSIGITEKQMKSTLRIELLLKLIITIPTGIIIGILLTSLLIAIVNALIPEITNSYNILFQLFKANEDIKIAIPISSIWLTILLMIIIVYIASLIPIKKACKFQPIELIRNTRNIKTISHSKKNTRNIITKLAFTNIEKFKGKYIAIIISLSISIVLIIVSSYYLENKFSEEIATNFNYMINIHYIEYQNHNLMNKIIEDLENSQLTENVIGLHGQTASLIVEEDNISNQEKDVSKYLCDGVTSKYAHFKIEKYKNIGKYCCTCSIYALGDEQYKEYMAKIGLGKIDRDYCVLIDTLQEKTKYYNEIKLTNYAVGDEILLNSPGDRFATETKLTIAKITDIIPEGIDTSSSIIIIVNEETMQENIETVLWNFQGEKSVTIYANTNRIYDLDEFVIELQNKYGLEGDISGSYIINPRIYEIQKLLSNIFIYFFICVITVIGILNMYSAITSTLEDRKKEIVSLATLGMERKQINKMLLLEVFICIIVALIIGISLGLLISYMIYLYSIDYIWYSFKIPWITIFIACISSICIILLSTLYFRKKLLIQDLSSILKKESI